MFLELVLLGTVVLVFHVLSFVLSGQLRRRILRAAPAHGTLRADGEGMSLILIVLILVLLLGGGGGYYYGGPRVGGGIGGILLLILVLWLLFGRGRPL